MARRPDPDALLRQLQAAEERQRRGRLKVFFGASPGVGKTYTMLEAARAKRAEGLDVVLGVVETHGREETRSLLDGLEVLPRRTVEYRGTRLEEFDLDAALERRPSLILVDELAHTNAPGSRHAKRWQDIEELLTAGIDVFTTVNVQHIESLNDVVSQITGVQVRETVPDSVLEQADEVELVDVSPDVLQQRLREGKVYVPEQAQRALDRFFKTGNLIALRELALRRTAERVDAQMRAHMQAEGIRDIWPAGDRVLVCVGPDAASARVVRAARRVAAGLKADWLAVYVETPAHRRLSEADRDAVSQNLRLAEQLGAQAITLSGHSVAEEILAYAHEHNVTRIIVGKPTRSRWRQGVRRSLLEALVRGSGDIDVHVITGDAARPSARPAPRYGPTSKPSHYAAAAAAIAVATLLGLVTRPWLQTVDFAMLYLLAVVLISSRYRRGPSLLASILAIAAFDFAFVPPYYSFAVSDAQYILTFAVMLVIALVMSRLTAQIREQAEAARAREARTASLYAMSRELAALTDEDALAGAVARHLGNTFAGASLVLLPDDAVGLLRRPASAPQLAEKEASVARWTFDHATPAGLGTATLPAARALYVPMVSSGTTVGVLGLTPADPRRLQDPVQRQLLDAFADQAAVAFERVALARRNQEGQLAFEAERLRTSLLSSLSHDLRTPLATIEGAASTLVQDPGSLSREARGKLAEGILHEADRMNRLVRNLLDMVRLESGMLQVQKEWYPLEEVVGVVLIRLDDRLAGHPVSTSLPPDLPLLQIDGLLMEQVLINLLENAVKHTPPGTRIEIGATVGPSAVTVEVADRGPGIPGGQEELIFDKFHRLPSADP
ncbi:MAG TPA: sensor histidine kinase KdpD, partial [Gemmatimonadales bacterium]|nr:sensor histidine kinase KdpD [Gemmatimonadales bacterium]